METENLNVGCWDFSECTALLIILFVIHIRYDLLDLFVLELFSVCCTGYPNQVQPQSLPNSAGQTHPNNYAQQPQAGYAASSTAQQPYQGTFLLLKLFQFQPLGHGDTSKQH